MEKNILLVSLIVAQLLTRQTQVHTKYYLKAFVGIYDLQVVDV